MRLHWLASLLFSYVLVGAIPAYCEAKSAKFDAEACSALLTENLALAEGLVPAGPLQVYREVREAMIQKPRMGQKGALSIHYPGFDGTLHWMASALESRVVTLRKHKLRQELHAAEKVLSRIKDLKANPKKRSIQAISKLSSQFSTVISLGLPHEKSPDLVLDFYMMKSAVSRSGWDRPRPLNQQRGFISETTAPATFIGYPTPEALTPEDFNRLSPLFVFYIGLAKDYVSFDYQPNLSKRAPPYSFQVHDGTHMSLTIHDLKSQYNLDLSKARVDQILKIENARLRFVSTLLKEISAIPDPQRMRAVQTVFFFLHHEGVGEEISYLFTANNLAKLDSEETLGPYSLNDVIEKITEEITGAREDPYFGALVEDFGKGLPQGIREALEWVKDFGRRHPGLGDPVL